MINILTQITNPRVSLYWNIYYSKLHGKYFYIVWSVNESLPELIIHPYDSLNHIIYRDIRQSSLFYKCKVFIKKLWKK